MAKKTARERYVLYIYEAIMSGCTVIMKCLSWCYWGALIVMIAISVVGSQVVRKSDDFRVYMLARNVAPYNVNQVTVTRNPQSPDITSLIVNVRGTEDKKHMRVIEYKTRDLVGLNRVELKKLIQSDTEASMANSKTVGKLVDMEPAQAKNLILDSFGDLLLLGVAQFSVPEVGFLIVTTIITLFRHRAKGKGRKALVIFTHWTKTSYFVSFLCMTFAVFIMSYPIMPTLLKWLRSLF